MSFLFQPGDRVRLTPQAVAFYGGAWPHWVPQAQGGGSAGTVLFAGERPHKPGAAPRPYYVRWDSGVENSYRVEDLQGVEEEGSERGAIPAKQCPDRAPGTDIAAETTATPPTEPPTDDEGEEDFRIVPFRPGGAPTPLI